MGQHGRMHAQRGAVSAISPMPPGIKPPAQRDARRYRRTASFRSRRSALSNAQQQTWERLWPHLGAAADLTPRPLDTCAWFGRDAPVVLELGCGSGTSTVAMAQSEPDIDVIAVDLYRRGLAQLLCAIEREKVPNVRMIRGDAVDVLELKIAAGSLTGVRVFFPDPWPKTRHHKRRLLQPATIALIADRLRPGGVLHAATDHAGYAEQIAVAGDAEPRLRRVDPDTWQFPFPVPISVVRPATKYETKARHAGNDVTELLWERR
jgi:tRNA (guanine-N7-)-methyltransferase